MRRRRSKQQLMAEGASPGRPRARDACAVRTHLHCMHVRVGECICVSVSASACGDEEGVCLMGRSRQQPTDL